MPYLKFPYRISNLQSQLEPSPIIPIKLKESFESRVERPPLFYVLLDTGADFSIFNYSQLILYFDLGNIISGNPICKVKGICGITNIWETRNEFIIDFDGFVWPTKLKVAQELPINILGRDFLNTFRVTFDGKEKQVIIEY